MKSIDWIVQMPVKWMVGYLQRKNYPQEAIFE